MTLVKMKRIYEPKETTDGFRILADRLWPRGLSKEEVDIDMWAKAITPGNALRTWYHAHPDSYNEFYHKYKAELNENPAVTEFLESIKTKPVISLLSSARNIHTSHLSILKELIENK